MPYLCDYLLCKRVYLSLDEAEAVERSRYPNEHTLLYKNSVTDIDAIRILTGVPPLYTDLYKYLDESYLGILDIESLVFCKNHDLLDSNGKIYALNLFADDVVNDLALCEYLLSDIDCKSTILYDHLSTTYHTEN